LDSYFTQDILDYHTDKYTNLEKFVSIAIDYEEFQQRDWFDKVLNNKNSEE